MKNHLIVKLYQPLADEASVPDWVTFIKDKSVILERLDPEVDRLLDEHGLKFWVTREYNRSGQDWSPEERKEGLNRTYRLILQEACDLPEQLVQQIKRLPSVQDARELDIGSAEVPTPEFAVQTSFGMPKAADLINLPYAQAFTKGSREVRIAVLDTGVDLGHQELAGKLVKGADFVHLDGLDTSAFMGDVAGYDDIPEDEVGHGTHVSGIIAAKGQQMDEGVAPGCSIMPIRVLATLKNNDRPVGAGIVDNINTGIKWAVDNGADVINMSLGIKHTGGGLPHQDVIRYALNKNVAVVAASGNDGTSERYYPGALPGVIAVGAVDNAGTVTSFTSYGANITVVAPGLNIYSSFARQTYAFATGTSQASPFVSGSIGLMKAFARQQNKELSNQDITFILKSTSDKADSRLRNEHAGYGLINLADAFKLLDHLLN